MGKSTISISMAIFHCYVSSPEGKHYIHAHHPILGVPSVSCESVVRTTTRWFYRRACLKHMASNSFCFPMLMSCHCQDMPGVLTHSFLESLPATFVTGKWWSWCNLARILCQEFVLKHGFPGVSECEAPNFEKEMHGYEMSSYENLNNLRPLGRANPVFDATRARKKAEQDSILLANRIRLLRAEDARTRKKIVETEKKTQEIQLGFICLLHFIFHSWRIVIFYS